MSPQTIREAMQMVDALRFELRLNGLLGRPARIAHIARGLDSLRHMVDDADGEPPTAGARSFPCPAKGNA
jgi:hypothetical protein